MVSGVGQREGVGPFEAQLRRFRARSGEHLLGEVAGHHLAAGGDGARQRDREIAGAGRDVDHPAAWPDRRELHRPLAPAVMQAGRHQRVHRVVRTGDAIEHRSHLARFERTGRFAGHLFQV
ncbi:MAG: hypothetical protein ABSF58_13570 [Solirubrobacteraceae bacterium]